MAFRIVLMTFRQRDSFIRLASDKLSQTQIKNSPLESQTLTFVRVDCVGKRRQALSGSTGRADAQSLICEQRIETTGRLCTSSTESEALIATKSHQYISTSRPDNVVNNAHRSVDQALLNPDILCQAIPHPSQGRCEVVEQPILLQF
jgi:hypothetical protein